jgi:hypothetical protein
VEKKRKSEQGYFEELFYTQILPCYNMRVEDGETTKDLSLSFYFVQFIIIFFCAAKKLKSFILIHINST